jgi:hypothetical protein
MNDEWIVDLTAVFQNAAVSARLPGDAVVAWDGRAWHWVWPRQLGARLAQLVIEVAPNLSRSQAPSSLNDAGFRLIASVWDADDPAGIWSRTYLSSPLAIIGLQTPLAPDEQHPLAALLRAAWVEMGTRLAAGAPELGNSPRGAIGPAS